MYVLRRMFSWRNLLSSEELVDKAVGRAVNYGPAILKEKRERVFKRRESIGKRGIEGYGEKEDPRSKFSFFYGGTYNPFFWLKEFIFVGFDNHQLAIARNAQYHIHKAAHGRLKHIANDMWDMAMERRDKKLIEQLFNTSSN
ncbi:hypothetical protein CUMW_059610 [Citrus unshiu]|nr:hypothetical protein CUMW_059610 [Citrus unshiu]